MMDALIDFSADFVIGFGLRLCVRRCTATLMKGRLIGCLTLGF